MVTETLLLQIQRRRGRSWLMGVALRAYQQLLKRLPLRAEDTMKDCV